MIHRRWSIAERCFRNSRCNVYKRNATINHSPQPVAKTSLSGLTLLIRFLYIINAQSRNKLICFRHNWKVLLSYSTSHFWQTLKLFQLKYCMLWLHITTTQINSGIRKQNWITWNKLTSYIDRMAQLTQILNIAAGEKLHLFIYGLKAHILVVLFMHQSLTYRWDHFLCKTKAWVFIKKWMKS